MAVLGKRYAKALIDAAQTSEKRNLLNEYLSEFAGIFNTNSEFQKIILDPRLDSNMKYGVVQELFSGKEDKMFLSFIRLLIDKKRIAWIDEIFSEYEILNREMNNELLIKIVSAVPLNDGEINGITDKYKRIYNVGSVKYATEIDRSLLGGVKVIVGNKVYDGSVRTKLENML